MAESLPVSIPQAEQVLVLLRAHRREWRQRFHLRRIGLFGSTARNEATAVRLRERMNPALPQAILREGVSA